ncbi:MAG: flagellin [Oleiphilaceae bacterium]|jgi:flagellin
MPQIINTNIASINAQRNLDTSQKDNQTALQRLSSGLRINSARDDAAGLAISTRFTTQVEGLKVGIRNAGDGVSLAQTAEGALGAMTSSLQRMRELALQSANATNSDIDRVAINAEVQQLKDEIDRLAEKTNFNGTKLLDGSFSNVNFQIGANEGESLSFSVNEVSGSTLGVGSDAGLSSFSTSTALAKGDLTINGISIEASRSASDTASVDNQAASAIAKAAAINLSEEDTGVRAMANTNTVAGANMTVSNGATGQIMINNVVISVNTGGNDLASDRSSVITAINSAAEQTGVVAIDSEDDAIGVILQAKDGRNITINSTANVALGSAGLTPGDTLAELGLANTGTYEGTITLTSSNGEDITISPGSGNVENTGFIEGTYAARSAIMNSNIQASGSAFEWDGNPDFDASGTGANVDFDLDITTSAGVGNVQITLTADLSPATTTALVSEFNTQIAADGDTNGVIEAYVIDEDDFVFGFRALSNEPDQAITVTANDVNVAGAFGMPQTGDTAVVSGTKSPLDSGDLVINGVQIGAAKSTDDTASDDTYNSSLKAASGIATAIAVNKSSDETGVSATVNSTSVTGSSAQGPAGESGQLYLNGVDIGVFTSSTNDELDKASAISQINLFTGQTGVTAEDNGSGISMIATDGRNISAAWNTDQNDSAVELSAAHFGIGGAGEIDFDTNDDATLEYTAAGIAKTTYSTVQFTSAGPINIEAGSNGTQALFNLGFDAGSFGGSEGGQLIKDVDVSSVEGALKAINGIDNALDQINLERANLGAIQNRFESTINNQAITAENFEQANSRIRDADFAAETAELSRTQVLQSAGLSILAQANGQPQQVLQLLQG